MTYAQPMADPTNVVGRRIGAYAIDGLLMLVLTIAVVYPIFISLSETAPSGRVQCAGTSNLDGNTLGDGTTFRTQIDSQFCFELGDEVRYIPEGDTGAFTAQAYGLAFGIQALNLVVLQGLSGASLGKLMVGLRVIRQDGQKAGLGWAALRWVLLFVDSFFCFLPGAILVFATKGHRRLGDMAASTFVVRQHSVGTPPQVPGVTGPVAWQGTGQQGYPGYPGQQQGGWPAGPAAPGGWAGPPTTGQSGTWAPTGTGTPPAPGGVPSGEGPTWDAARNAYIQYDRGQGAWVQWDEDTKAWRPIDQ